MKLGFVIKLIELSVWLIVEIPIIENKWINNFIQRLQKAPELLCPLSYCYLIKCGL